MNDVQQLHGPADAHAPELEAGEHGHPGGAEYVRIAVILAVLTAIEVALYYLDTAKATLVALLSVLMVGKFTLVALFFMHLKFDNRLFSWLFTGGIVTTITAFITVLAMFRIF